MTTSAAHVYIEGSPPIINRSTLLLPLTDASRCRFVSPFRTLFRASMFPSLAAASLFLRINSRIRPFSTNTETSRPAIASQMWFPSTNRAGVCCMSFSLKIFALQLPVDVYPNCPSRVSLRCTRPIRHLGCMTQCCVCHVRHLENRMARLASWDSLL
ncbi:hypothetical protein K458DRAFT_188000 [Lentithecium fluviatile CBS 122367]|uniref:Uncharacterized protein n=1 Tax=Lentithecium fluviatile CBS 122367 TaxID=1168545 RepID=A0A6G1JAI4_9PLEO|nr:hypothetical protein K458DRAFT_188000 [Lentithecium fluviatile CBS 122367]